MWAEPVAAVTLHLAASKHKEHNWPRAQGLVLKFIAVPEPKSCFPGLFPGGTGGQQGHWSRLTLGRHGTCLINNCFSRTPDNDSAAESSYARCMGGLKRFPPRIPSLSPSLGGRLAMWSDGSPGFSQLPLQFLSILSPNKILIRLVLSWCLFLKGHGLT